MTGDTSATSASSARCSSRTFTITIMKGSSVPGSSSNHSCAVSTKGSVKCWGFNTYGELGDGTTVTSHKPVKVLGFA